MSLEQTKHRAKAVGTIHDIVNAMRAIAAGRIQSAQRALASARRFQHIIEQSILALDAHADGLWLPELMGRPALVIVMTSEQPFCGAFNQNVLALAERRCRELRQKNDVHLLVVGHRGIRQLTTHGLTPDQTEAAATSLPGLRDLVKRLASIVDQRIAAGKLGALHVIYSRYQSISHQLPTEEPILPIDPKNLASTVNPAPRKYHRYLELPVLLAGLVSQYAFISLYRAAADSYASEQASRLVAMDGATRNTDKILKSLRDLERRERQDEITRQVLELIGSRFAME